MEIYVLKSIACLTVFYSFYKLFLEKESFHNFKRVYLLSALAIAFIIPFITFTEYIIIEPLTESITTRGQVSYVNDPIEIIEKQINYIPIVLWSIYGLGVLFFGVRLGRNLWKLIRKIKNNPHLKMQSVFHVLLQSSTVPHTFLSYVFLHKKAYNQKEIPQEVLDHERIHAQQLHTLDILLIELIQVVFWFNPILYFYKRSIKLNHEFLADSGVLKQGINPTQYQNILLAFSSNALSPTLANSINYSSIKKRFTVMKKHTSSKKLSLLLLLLVPVLSLLVYSFSTREQVFKPLIEETPNPNLTARSMEVKILDNGTYDIDGKIANKETFAKVAATFNQDITSVDRNRILNIHIIEPKIAPREEVQFIFDALWDYGFHRLVSGEQEVFRSKGNTPLAVEDSNVSKTTSNEYKKALVKSRKKDFIVMISISEIDLNGKPSSLKTFSKDVDALTKDWEETDYTSITPNVLIASTPKSFLNKVEIEFQKTHYAKANGGMKLIPPPPPTPDAPPAPMDEDGLIAISSILERGTLLNDKLNDYHKNGADFFYNELKTGFSFFKAALKSAEPFVILEKKYQDGSIEIHLKETNSKNNNVKFNTKYGTPPPPPPPAPEEPLDHIIKMAKKGATFYLEGQKVSSDMAIQVVKNNKELNIQIRNEDSKNPSVYITKEPIKLQDAPQLAVYLKNLPKVGPMPDLNDTESFVKYMHQMGIELYKGLDKITLDEALELVKGKKLFEVREPHEYSGPPKVIFTEGC